MICTVQLVSQPIADAGPQALATAEATKMNVTAVTRVSAADRIEILSFSFFIFVPFAAG